MKTIKKYDERQTRPVKNDIEYTCIFIERDNEMRPYWLYKWDPHNILCKWYIVTWY